MTLYIKKDISQQKKLLRDIPKSKSANHNSINMHKNKNTTSRPLHREWKWCFFQDNRRLQI